MSIIHEIATMTAKGQITLPKAVRQALGVDVGAKVAFALREDGQIVVDKSQKYQWELGQWEDPSSYIAG